MLQLANLAACRKIDKNPAGTEQKFAYTSKGPWVLRQSEACWHVGGYVFALDIHRSAMVRTRVIQVWYGIKCSVVCAVCERRPFAVTVDKAVKAPNAGLDRIEVVLMSLAQSRNDRSGIWKTLIAARVSNWSGRGTET